jgi:hypothetical protein
MFPKPTLISLLIVSFTLFFITADAQKKNKSGGVKQHVATTDYLFQNDEVLHIKLTGRLNALYNDRYKNIAYHPMLLQYKAKEGDVTPINITVKTRGNFRRRKENCRMPPLMLNFTKKGSTKGTPFENQNKLKLVVPCTGDEYVIREYLVYKLYNLLTDKSFRARLVQVEFEDSVKKTTDTQYCFLLEDEKKMADRFKSFIWDRKMLSMKAVDKKEFLIMAVFQYMIGNTDWSVPFLQNIKLVTSDTTHAPYAVPYDFDHAGIVDAPYAGPPPELELSSTRERVYRGFCIKDKKTFAETFELFKKLKDDFYKVYTNCPLISAKYIKSTTKFLDDFYKVINNDKAIETEFGNPCRVEMRVELKGLDD